MESLFWLALIGIGIYFWVKRSKEKQKEKEMKILRKRIREDRIREARSIILNSGNQKLIDQMHLMYAAQQFRKDGDKEDKDDTNISAMKVAGGVVGGIVLADIATSAAQAHALEQAFADIQADMDPELSRPSRPRRVPPP
ncbi:MAG: hypothetical protein OXI01_23820 [Albidovulum sp.]|nr:hypothetical protein [Albidovulum sp.]